jgi:hypothetical protein
MAFLPTIRSPVHTPSRLSASREPSRAAAIPKIQGTAPRRFGGYELNNGSNGAFGAQLGGDFRIGIGTISLDAIGNYNRDAVNLTLSGAPTNAAGVSIGTMLPTGAHRYTVQQYQRNAARQVYGRKAEIVCRYEWMQFAPPSDPFTVPGSGFTTIVGDFVCLDCATATTGTNINSTAYSASAGFKDKVLQVFWAGARYSVTDTVDVVGAYYHYDQNNSAASAANLAACNVSSSNKNFCGACSL